ncbi:hypothetical protein ACHBTE_21455 [Streptomyces sp. M41]|uniref:hypothetical protein n=1 Tax=Streptomyces sp. M41 TaxID=3059412 RepID=UPI00374DCDBF
MSRETDTPSSGPNGRGGAAYPSGTPPYGTPMVSDSGADAGRAATQPEERKTETTLTTRIRINIPGSRPIPPVVVRKPVAEAESSAAKTDAEAPAPTAPTAPPASASTGTVEPAAGPAAQPEEKTSDWFAPRKSSPSKPGQGGPPSNGAGLPGGSGPAAGGAGGAGAGRPGGVVGSMSAPGGSRPGGAKGAGLPGATGGPVAPGHGGGTGSFDVTEALAAGPLGNGNSNGNSNSTGNSSNGNGSRPGAEARRDDLPYFSENGGQSDRSGSGGGGYGAQGRPGGFDPAADFNAPNGFDGSADFNGPGDFSGPNGRAGQGPSGPTTGPVTGDGPPVPPVTGGGQRGLRGPGAPGGPGISNGPGSGISTGPSGPPGPAGPGASPHTPGRGPGGGLSDDTAILTPQKPAPEPGGNPQYGGVADNVSGHTVTSGIPVVPPGAQGGPFGPGGSDGPVPHTPPKLPEPAASNTSTSRAPKKKGRNKLALIGSGVIVLGGGLYGAGLLMNHSDVPKGTTVLGVEIGGGTRDDAIKKLNDAFDEQVGKPLKLSVGGRTVSLEPDKAGLQFDMQQTVSAAASSDYNPVSVIGSLFGNHRVVDPVMPTDEEKLHAALESASGGSGSVTEGTIKFQAGKAVAVYGKAGKGIDVAKSTAAVEQAYRTQVETGSSDPVTVPTTTQQPTVSNAEVDRMMKEFAQPAMSAPVTVQAAGVSPVPMSPEKSLWKFLRVKAVNGKLVDSPDLAALKQLYGGAFDGVLITRGNGKKTPVTPEDVYGALRQALKSKGARTAVIETNPT